MDKMQAWLGKAKKRQALAEKERKNTQGLVLRYLQNNDFEKAADAVCGHLTSQDDLTKIFLQYPPPNKTCPICKEDTIKQNFNPHAVKWEHESFCKPCALSTYTDGLNKKIDGIMAEKCSKRYAQSKINDFSKTYGKLHESSSGLFLHGDRGVGKTYLMAAILREIILTSEPKWCFDKFVNTTTRSLLFISTPELLMEIRSCYNKKDVYEEDLLDKYGDAEVLFLDDLGSEKPTEWALQTLYLIIDRRYRNMKKTIISSNYSLNQISQRLDDRISSRIAGMCQIIRMQGKDRRIGKALGR